MMVFLGIKREADYEVLYKIWTVKRDKPYTPLPFSFVVFMMHLAELKYTSESDSLMVSEKG